MYFWSNYENTTLSLYVTGWIDFCLHKLNQFYIFVHNKFGFYGNFFPSTKDLFIYRKYHLSSFICVISLCFFNESIRTITFSISISGVFHIYTQSIVGYKRGSSNYICRNSIHFHPLILL